MANERKHGILVAVDDSAATKQTLRYVARMMAGRSDVGIRLLHLLPPVPPDLLEHGGAENPDVEHVLDKELREARDAWIKARQEDAEPLLDNARSILAADFPRDAVTTECRPSVDGVAVARDCIEAAADSGCRTIAIGRDSLPWHREFLHTHACDELVKHAKGVTVWVVEPASDDSDD